MKLHVIERPDGSHALRQPCAALGPSGCTAYEARPSTCRTFQCLLLKALAEGEVSFEEAHALVDEVRAATDPGPLLRQYFRWQNR